jgi:hemerythrin
MPVLEFLVNWVGHHIMTSDQEIGRYARGRSGAEAVATSPAGSSL